MFELETIFSVCNYVAMAGWLGLILFPKFEWVTRVGARIIIPSLIAVVYIILMVIGRSQGTSEGNFSSLAGVAALFSVKEVLLAGWVHYLAFDLFVGSCIAENSRKHNISHWLVIPCLLFTFLAGPIGLLMYYIIWQLRTVFFNTSVLAKET